MSKQGKHQLNYIFNKIHKLCIFLTSDQWDICVGQNRKQFNLRFTGWRRPSPAKALLTLNSKKREKFVFNFFKLRRRQGLRTAQGDSCDVSHPPSSGFLPSGHNFIFRGERGSRRGTWLKRNKKKAGSENEFLPMPRRPLKTKSPKCWRAADWKSSQPDFSVQPASTQRLLCYFSGKNCPLFRHSRSKLLKTTPSAKIQADEDFPPFCCQSLFNLSQLDGCFLLEYHPRRQELWPRKLLS